MKRYLMPLLFAAALPAGATDMRLDGTYLSFWNPTGPDIGYLYAGFVTRQPNPDLADWSTFTVGAQINAGNAAGVNQMVWGIATEAWAYPGSVSHLFGIEATTINMEPSNTLTKVAAYLTFKNRPDNRFDDVGGPPMNANSQAVRIDAQPGTGFERGIVFGSSALHVSAVRARPVAIDFSDMSLPDAQAVEIMRFPDGCALAYLGRGVLGARCDAGTP